MLMESSGEIAIDVSHVNADPRPACSPLAGLVSISLEYHLRGLGDPALPPTASPLEIAAQLKAEYSTALEQDSLFDFVRTTSLKNLVENSARGRIINGEKAYDLLCGLTVARDLAMSTEEEQSRTGLALLAYDPDEKGALAYRIALEGPDASFVYAAIAVPSQTLPEVNQGCSGALAFENLSSIIGST
jgi:hypothetical protein